MKKLLVTLIAFCLLLLFTSSTVNAQIAPGGGMWTILLSYWSLDEESGTRYDSHGDVDLTDVNTTGYTTGIHNNAGYFNSSNNERLENSVNATDVNYYPFSITAWVSTTNATNSRGIVDHYESNNGFAFFVKDGELAAHYFSPESGGNIYPLEGGYVADGEWHMVTLVVDADGGHLYVDEAHTATESWSAAGPGTITTTVPVRIGYRNQQYYYDGAIDEVAIWKSDLSYTQITWLYNDGNGREYTELGGFNTYSTQSGYYVFMPAIVRAAGGNTGEGGLDGDTDESWWDWARGIDTIVEPIFSRLTEALSGINELQESACGDSFGTFLAGHNYDSAVELELGPNPSVKEVAYVMGISIGRPVGWLRAIINETSSLGFNYLTMLLYFMVGGMTWIVFVSVVSYSARFIRAIINTGMDIIELLPFT